MELAGRVALVTGGGRGISESTALKLAARGADLVVAARTRAEIEAVGERVLRCRMIKWPKTNVGGALFRAVPDWIFYPRGYYLLQNLRRHECALPQW
jgi:NAD(P)-dependent dehydrogenase (short-subunit alcohol dehydrogenase family)